MIDGSVGVGWTVSLLRRSVSFEADLDWILTDKLGENLVLAIQKRNYNGLRGLPALGWLLGRAGCQDSLPG